MVGVIYNESLSDSLRQHNRSKRALPVLFLPILLAGGTGFVFGAGAGVGAAEAYRAATADYDAVIEELSDAVEDYTSFEGVQKVMLSTVIILTRQ